MIFQLSIFCSWVFGPATEFRSVVVMRYFSMIEYVQFGLVCEAAWSMIGMSEQVI